MELYNLFSAGLSLVGRLDAANGFPARNAPGSTAPSESVTRRTAAPETLWSKLASQYNVRSMTAEETASLSQELYNAGELSLFDHALLSFDPHRVSLSGKTVPDGRRDLIAQYEARVDLDQRTGNHRNLANDERILGCLKRLEAGRGPIHLTA
jgi:hypothetical protein